MASKLTLTVSQLNEYVRRIFQMDPMLLNIELKGEISNLKFHQNRMLFFTLKDEQAAVSCVMYPDDTMELQTEPFEGMRAILKGSAGLYARGGQYQFVAKHIQAQGVGVLYERLLALKGKLKEEGLFDSARKKPIPAFVNTVGVVSSPTGAVIHDILNVSLRRNPQGRILLCPVRVQGMGAAQEIAQAIQILDQLEHISVIVVARGGGSIEDLWAFNEECVVRAVAECSKPIVSAVGHETDVTLCDLAADLRVPTPSAAAECVTPIRAEVEDALHGLRRQLKDAAERMVSKREAELKLARSRLSNCQPNRELDVLAMLLTQQRGKLHAAMMMAADSKERKLEQKKKELSLLNPYRVLARGYAIVQKGESAIADASALCKGDVVTLRFADGSVQALIAEEKK